MATLSFASSKGDRTYSSWGFEGMGLHPISKVSVTSNYSLCMNTIIPSILLHLLPTGGCAGVMFLDEEHVETLSMGESEAYVRHEEQEKWKGDFCL